MSAATWEEREGEREREEPSIDCERRSGRKSRDENGSLEGKVRRG